MKIAHIGFHKDVFKPSLLKSIAVFLVFVFAWTNLGIYQVVYAATTSNSQHPAVSSERNNSKELSGFPPDKGETRGLEGIIKRIRERAEKAEGKVKTTGIKSEKAEFQKEKSELDAINTARTSPQFTARTRKLKAFLEKVKPPQKHIKINPNKTTS